MAWALGPFGPFGPVVLVVMVALNCSGFAKTSNIGTDDNGLFVRHESQVNLCGEVWVPDAMAPGKHLELTSWVGYIRQYLDDKYPGLAMVTEASRPCNHHAWTVGSHNGDALVVNQGTEAVTVFCSDTELEFDEGLGTLGLLTTARDHLANMPRTYLGAEYTGFDAVTQTPESVDTVSLCPVPVNRTGVFRKDNRTLILQSELKITVDRAVWVKNYQLYLSLRDLVAKLDRLRQGATATGSRMSLSYHSSTPPAYAPQSVFNGAQAFDGGYDEGPPRGDYYQVFNSASPWIKIRASGMDLFRIWSWRTSVTTKVRLWQSDSSSGDCTSWNLVGDAEAMPKTGRPSSFKHYLWYHVPASITKQYVCLQLLETGGNPTHVVAELEAFAACTSLSNNVPVITAMTSSSQASYVCIDKTQG